MQDFLSRIRQKTQSKPLLQRVLSQFTPIYRSKIIDKKGKSRLCNYFYLNTNINEAK